MKPRTRLVGLALAVSFALGGGYLLGEHDRGGSLVSQASASSAAPQGEQAAPERKILYYRNPMGLPDTSPVPKKDPMGMDYIPVYAGDQPDDTGVVSVSPARVQTLGVRTALAETRVLDAVVRATGRIEINERAEAVVAPRFEGWIERLHVNAVGDPVRRGQPLFTIYSPELQSASEELRIAERLQRESAASDTLAAEAAGRLAEATRERLRNWEIAVPAGGQAVMRQTYYSPANGVVIEKNAVQGARFTPGEPIYRIADLSRVWVMADIFEQDLARVKVGQSATVILDAFPGRVFEAKLSYLYPTLNAATRTTPVRLELDNREGLLRPGMFAHVELASATAAAQVTVPGSALIDDGTRQVVLLALGEGRFKPQSVRIGKRGREFIEVLEGVQAGDRVVVSANFLIDSESQLKAALSNLSETNEAGTAKGQTGSAQTYSAEGTLDAIQDGAVTVSHGAIPELKWPAMTMAFELESPAVAAGMAPGTPVRIQFEERGPGKFVVTRIERKAGGKSAPAPAHPHGSH